LRKVFHLRLEILWWLRPGAPVQGKGGLVSHDQLSRHAFNSASCRQRLRILDFDLSLQTH
jgi:hypothetical protein